MRAGLVILAAISALAIFDIRASTAGEKPWCALYNDPRGGSKSCGFVDLDQCRASVGGIGGICIPNPAYSATVEPYHAPRHHRRLRWS